MSEVTWNNGLHNRSRHPGAIIVGADGSVREFDRNGCMGVYAVIELDHERNGKWSNSTYRIVMSAGVRFFDWVPDFDTCKSFHDCSTWDEVYAQVLDVVGQPLNRESLVATLSAMRKSLAERINKSEAVLASLKDDEADVPVHEIVNLTPHELVFHLGDERLIIPPSGTVARCAVERIDTGVRISGIPVNRSSFGAVSDLPEAQDGVVYVVSAIVATAAHRADVLSVDDAVRDDAGRIIGARALATFVA